MKCRLCKWLCDRYCPPEMRPNAFSEYSTSWERDNSNDWDLWQRDGEAIHRQSEIAASYLANDRGKAFAIYTSMADAGSAWAMRLVADYFEHGVGVQKDLRMAESYYSRALLAGSNSAYVDFAALHYRQGNDEKWNAILEQGVAAGYAPAAYWLVLFRYQRNPSRAMARSLRSTLELAAKAGHPEARLMLSRWKGRRVFGFREIRQGFREYLTLMDDAEKKQRRIQTDEKITKAAA
ncbi:MAG: sel1 repeat family protein [Erythrobacter sp.]|nr:MAG: sel1 repeat family protein [Erythrobacter sp.]